MSVRSERGATSFWLVVAVALVAGALVALPFALAGRQEAKNGQQAVGEIGKANDVSAQATMQTAIQAVSTYFAEHASYLGFGPQAASQYDPSVRYTIGPATPDVVSIRGVMPTSVVLVTSTGSGFLCAAESGGVVAYGRADAQTAAACVGGW